MFFFRLVFRCFSLDGWTTVLTRIMMGQIVAKQIPIKKATMTVNIKDLKSALSVLSNLFLVIVKNIGYNMKRGKTEIY